MEMTQRNILIRVQVDADQYEGWTDEQIMELLFQGNSLPGGATVTVITPYMTTLSYTPMNNQDPDSGDLLAGCAIVVVAIIFITMLIRQL